MSAFEKFPVALPHPNEQRKIAEFLSALDHKIELVAQELTLARSFKAGLLQQMFV
jgi:type I restriction enzyme S subunit